MLYFPKHAEPLSPKQRTNSNFMDKTASFTGKIPLVILVGILGSTARVLAQDDHGNTRTTATKVEFGACIPGKISPLTDRDWFTFTVSGGPKQIYAYTTGLAALEAGLYKGSVVEREFSSPYSCGNMIFSEFLTNGTYSVDLYFKENPDFPEPVGGYEYQFCLKTSDQAVPMKNFTVEDSMTTCGELDLHSFEIKKDAITFVYSTGPTDVDGELFSSKGELVEGSGDTWEGKNFLIRRFLPAGTYLLAVVNGNDPAKRIGPYAIHVETKENAIPAFEAEREDALSVPGEVDLFKVEISKKGRAVFYTTGATDTEGTLFDSLGNNVSSAGDNWTGKNFSLEADIKDPGTYYLAIQGGGGGTSTGAYQVGFRPPNTAINITKAGGKSYSLDPLGDIDYYTFTAKAGRIVLASTGSLETEGVLLDADGQNIVTENNGNARDFSITRNVTEGTYYLIVRGQRPDVVKGNYGLTASFTPGTSTSISRAGADLPGTAQNYNFTVYSTGAWKTTDVPSWITVEPGSGNGDRDVTVKVATNGGAEPRTATIKFEGAPHIVTQGVAVFRVPKITIGPPSKGNFDVFFTTDQGYNYQLFSTENLQANGWSTTGDLIKGTGSEVKRQFSANKKAAFYRVEVK